MTEIPPRFRRRPGVDWLAVLEAVGRGARTVGFACFTWLFVLAAMDVWAISNRAGAVLVCLLAPVPAFFTYRFFLRFLDAVDLALST